MLGELFDPRSEVFIRERCRPHWSQAGAVVFVTFRTHDSLPRSVVESGWEVEKQEWMRARGYDTGRPWTETLPTLTSAEQFEFRRTFNSTREMALDACHGRCPFRSPTAARLVADALLHFDRDRYRMGDFVVMPNHVHLLAAFPDAAAMNAQCTSWLHFTAVRVNRLLGERGRMWQHEPFDHLVRSPEQYDHFREYIADNPRKAGLREGEYLHHRYEG